MRLMIAGVLLAALLAPLATAESPAGFNSCAGESIAVANDDNDDDDALIATISGPCGTVPMGGSFAVTISWGTEESDYAVLTPLEVAHIHGCTILQSDTRTAISEASATSWYEIRMDSEECDFIVLATTTAGSLLTPTDEVYVFLSVNVAAFTMHDIGQSPSLGFGALYLPVIVIGLLFGMAFFRGLQQHPLWAGVLFFATWGLISVLVDVPAAIDLSPIFTFLAIMAWIAFTYIGVGAGFPQWFSRSKEKKNNKED